MSSYPTANESFTPERDPRRLDAQNDASFESGASTQTPVFSRSHGQLPGGRGSFATNASANTSGGSSRAAAMTDAAGSPPMLGASNQGNAAAPSGASHGIGSLYADYPHAAVALQTPLTRHKPHLAPPSTAHVPSQHMLFSSPAPFWKYANLGSTPARPFEALESPEKKRDEDSADDEGADDVDETMMVDKDEDEAEPTEQNEEIAIEGLGDKIPEAETAEPAHGSSPPLLPNSKSLSLSLEGLDAPSGEDDDASPNEASPSRTISRPVSRQLPSGPAPMAQSQPPMPKLNLGAAPVLNATTGNGVGAMRVTAGASDAGPRASSSGLLVGEEGGIDLAK